MDGREVGAAGAESTRSMRAVLEFAGEPGCALPKGSESGDGCVTRIAGTDSEGMLLLAVVYEEAPAVVLWKSGEVGDAGPLEERMDDATCSEIPPEGSCSS